MDLLNKGPNYTQRVSSASSNMCTFSNLYDRHMAALGQDQGALQIAGLAGISAPFRSLFGAGHIGARDLHP